MKKTGLNGYMLDFSVSYNTIKFSNIVDIHKYLMKNFNIKQCLQYLNKDLLQY